MSSCFNAFVLAWRCMCSLSVWPPKGERSSAIPCMRALNGTVCSTSSESDCSPDPSISAMNIALLDDP